MQKRGISPLIATVLIVGFTIALAAIVITWGSTFLKQIQASTEETAGKQLTCENDVGLVVKNAQLLGDKIKVLIENVGNRDINKFNVRVIGSDGVDTAEINSGLASSGIQSFVVGFDPIITGPINDLEIFPVISYAGEQAACTNAYGKKKDVDFTNNLGSSIEVLSIYPCGCLVDDIASNFPEMLMNVDCVSYSGFSSSYDLSKYEVVIMDGADCWGEKSLDINSRNYLENFVLRGGGFIVGHDTVCYNGWSDWYDLIGVSRVGNPGSSGSTSRVIVNNAITKLPYELPTTFDVQTTHTTGDCKPDQEIISEDFNDGATHDYYLINKAYGSGRVALTEWGHSAYTCGCGLAGGVPGVDEQKAIINAIYWVAGAT